MNISKGIIKAASFMLFIVMALQLTGITCYGEELTIGSSNLQADHQVKNATPDGQDTTGNSTGGVDDSFHCPCHISFTQPLPVTLAYHSSIVLDAIPSDQFYLKNISTRFFQPPRTIL